MTVDLAPADVRKDSPGLDLPIAVGLLASYCMVPEETVKYAALYNLLFGDTLAGDDEIEGEEYWVKMENME